MRLNEEQRLVVEYKDPNPLVVLAGAGSGKTAVMTARVQEIIKRGVKPNRILCITFTNRAAQELLRRLNINEDEPHPRVGTIHSIALSLIRKDPKGFGLGDHITPIDEYDQKVILQTIIERYHYEIKSYVLREKLQFHRARGVGFRLDYTEDVHKKALEAYGGYHALNEDELRVWAEYEKEKSRQSVVDFDDMLHLLVQRGRKDSKWLARLQKHFDHVLMDEAQDTNCVQWAVVNLFFADDNHNLTVVGDLSQSIYGFAGAAPEILHDFTKGWRGVEPLLFKLEKNHRSVPEVVALANRIQKTMTETIPLKMLSHRGIQGEKGSTSLLTAQDQRYLSMNIAANIIQDRKRMSYDDIAILVRSGSQVRDIEPELVRNKIPYVIRGASGFLQTEEVRDILSYLRVSVNPLDYPAFKRSATTPKRGVGDKALEEIRARAVEHEGNLLVASEGLGKLGLYTRLIRQLQQLEDPIQALDLAIQGSHYENYLRDKYKKDKDKIEIKLTNLSRLKETIQGLMDTLELTLPDIVFQLAMNGREEESEEGRVVVSTIHSSKGLEWKRVYVYGAYEGQMPHKFSQSEKEIEEERRILYVACTRARDSLVLGIPGAVVTDRTTTYVAPSRFLKELGIC